MKRLFKTDLLPAGGILIMCSSHEARCEALVERSAGWKPNNVLLFHYDDENPKREERHSRISTTFKQRRVHVIEQQFTEADAVKSLRDNMQVLQAFLHDLDDQPIVFDISVFTKRHLLMMLRWLDDEGCWDRVTFIYSEPQEYDVSLYVPLSFGLASFHQVPGFSACPDFSRALHLVMFLGYEGDRAFAAYEHVQPVVTTLLIPFPPFKPSWEGKTEELNRDVISLVGEEHIRRVDPVDPSLAHEALSIILGDGSCIGEHAKVVCPLGTKPQTLGVYSYVRTCVDPPAIVYASPLRHNHNFFSHGVGNTWLLKVA
jgi:hypothetical protein